MLAGLAILGVAIAAYLVERSLGASAGSRWAADIGEPPGAQIAPDEPGGPLPDGAVDEPGGPVPDGVVDEPDGAVPDGVVDEADGLVPDGQTVSVFDEDVPAVGGLDPDLFDALRRAATDAAAAGVGLRVNSGWRSAELQWRLWQEAVVEHLSPEEAARWVATPGTSAHVTGEAVDVGPRSAAAWLSEHGAAYGLCQIYDNEPWHYELRPDAVDGGCPPMYADPTEDPRMQP